MIFEKQTIPIPTDIDNVILSSNNISESILKFKNLKYSDEDILNIINLEYSPDSIAQELIILLSNKNYRDNILLQNQIGNTSKLIN